MKIFCFVLCCYFLSACVSSKLKENRTLLKEYAFCKCLEHASKDSSFFQDDISISVYREIASYNDTAFVNIDSLAKEAAFQIKPSQIADHENRKAILSDCFLFYKSKKLDSAVKSLDKEFFKSW